MKNPIPNTQGLMRREVLVLSGFQMRQSRPQIALEASSCGRYTEVFRPIFVFNAFQTTNKKENGIEERDEIEGRREEDTERNERDEMNRTWILEIHRKSEDRRLNTEMIVGEKI